MHRIFLTTLITILVGCSSAAPTMVEHPTWSQGATIYELNTRQLTPEGTFKAATAELPRIKELGVDIIWVMPIQPIGVKERKGSLGSYYAIKDYKAFNPEFGTRADFEEFLSEAHRLGMKVILDWVGNHTSPDHIWAENNGWHKRDSLGEMKVKYDWTDISEVEFENKDMRAAMKDAMMWWADTIGVDGFRCDMAMLVPIDFWEESVGAIRAKHPDFFMLAEAEEPYLTDSVFNAFYGWDLHHTLNALASGKITADSLGRQLAKTAKNFPSRAMRLNFTSNHDENSWAGSAIERMGSSAPQMAALTYILPGLPLIYNGQEFGNDKRIKFFDKDTIAHNGSSPYVKLYRALNSLRDNNRALTHGTMKVLETSNPKEIFALERTDGDNRVVAIFNFSDSAVETKVEVSDGEFTDFLSGAIGAEEVAFSPSNPITLGAGGYKIYIQK